ncbi:tRNA epoxyqueuosine(34) reductase QueG [Rubritalea sp.]|uniref:tRNA epoxyqueuosine(34) reductase QueG n=1 Tax=Rubritalea sp. TaxID=2109375 RepID=UPI003EF93275
MKLQASMEFTAEIQKRNIQFIAKQLGFSDCRIATVKRATHADRYLDWVDQGCAGEMAWLERNKHKRVHPGEVLEGARSIVTLALNYYPGEQATTDDYKIARYAWNDDYHDLIEEKLSDLDLALSDMGGKQRYYVDTGPVLERDFANDAGLGWNGKSTVQIHPKFGTWFFLCELITTLELEPDKPFGDHCGKCTRCIDNCPTNAITGPREMDARLCISYLTIEHGGSIPEELRPLIGDRIYGCDVCLDVCPWNRFAKMSQETKLHARQEIFQYSLRDFAKMDVESFRKTFAKSPIKRIKHNRFIRNVCVALGNTGTTDDLKRLQELSESTDALIAEHAQWAVTQIEQRNS